MRVSAYRISFFCKLQQRYIEHSYSHNLLTHYTKVLKSGASDPEIYNSIEMFKEKFADYGRDRRSAMEFHLRNVVCVKVSYFEYCGCFFLRTLFQNLNFIRFFHSCSAILQKSGLCS